MEFFYDEYRCPVYVKDVVTIILTLIDKWLSGNRAIIYALWIIMVIDCEKLRLSCFQVLVLMEDFDMVALGTLMISCKAIIFYHIAQGR